MIENIVSRICNTCNNGDFACKRQDWCDQKLGGVLGVPKTLECPMMQFPAKEDPDKRAWHERLRDRTLPPQITLDDIADVCDACKYSEVDGDVIDLSKHYMDVCIYCQANQIRENIEECAAEARMS